MTVWNAVKLIRGREGRVEKNNKTKTNKKMAQTCNNVPWRLLKVHNWSTQRITDFCHFVKQLTATPMGGAFWVDIFLQDGWRVKTEFGGVPPSFFFSENIQKLHLHPGLNLILYVSLQNFLKRCCTHIFTEMNDWTELFSEWH